MTEEQAEIHLVEVEIADIGLAPDFSRRGVSHCCVPSSAVAVKVMQIAMKINKGVNKDFKLRTVSDSMC